MKELWIKKTVVRRYLIEDDTIDEAKSVIESQPEIAEEFIENWLDRNARVEYDSEEMVLPIDYSIADVIDLDGEELEEIEG